VFVVCLPPDHISAPYYISSTKTEITLGWTEPHDTGGCPILSYVLYMDSGDGSGFNEIDSDEITNKPYLKQHTVAGLTDTGSFYGFKIGAYNEIDEIVSLARSYKLAAVPSKPSNPPRQDFAQTTENQIKVEYD